MSNCVYLKILKFLSKNGIVLEELLPFLEKMNYNLDKIIQILKNA